MDGDKKKGCCTAKLIAKILVIIGGVNWGLIGIGMLFGFGSDWNLVHFIFSFSSVVEAIVYILVGIAAVMMIFSCKCRKCQKPEMPMSNPVQ